MPVNSRPFTVNGRYAEVGPKVIMDPAAVRDHLGELLASPQFSSAPSLIRFLRFVVEESLAGRADFLKEYAIGVAVFDRGENFDPRLDPIVRVQAGKLRTRLQRYYAGEGANAAIRLDVPKGSYVPVIAVAGRARGTPRRSRWLLGAGVAAAALGGILLAWWFWSPGGVTQWEFARLTTAGGFTTHPALSPDGRLLAYSSDRGAGRDADIWVQPLSGGTPVQVTKDPAADTSPDFSPDGSEIVFRSWRDGGGIYIVGTSGGRERRVTSRGFSPRFSPDGKSVAFAYGGIFIVPAAGGEPRAVSGNLTSAGCPLWTPGGREVLFLAQTREGAFDWWVASASAGSPPHPAGVTARLRQKGLPALHEGACPSDWDGNAVLFALKVDRLGSIWRIALAPGDWTARGPAVQLEPGPGIGNPRAVPGSGGTQLVFSTEQTATAIWRLDARGESAEPVTRDASLRAGLEGTRPALSAGGEWLVFASARSGSLDLWRKSLATGDESALTNDPGAEDYPLLSADGTRLVFESVAGTGRSVVEMQLPQRTRRALCGGCGTPLDLSPDGGQLLLRQSESHGLSLLDTRTLRVTPLFADPERLVQEAAFSPAMDWIALVVRSPAQVLHRAYLAPFDGRRLGPAGRWIPVIDEPFHLYLRWSPSGDRVYFFSARDDSRCLWTAVLDAETGRPVRLLPLRHFHGMQHQPLFGSWIAVSRAGFAVNLTSTSSDIWLAKRVRR